MCRVDTRQDTLLKKIKRLEDELLVELHAKEAQFRYQVHQRKVHFRDKVEQQHRKLTKTIHRYLADASLLSIVTKT